MENQIERIVDRYLGMSPKDLRLNSWNQMRSYMIDEIKNLVEKGSKPDVVQVEKKGGGDKVRIKRNIYDHDFKWISE